jgi:hypothetical protein
MAAALGLATACAHGPGERGVARSAPAYEPGSREVGAYFTRYDAGLAVEERRHGAAYGSGT